MGSKFLVGAVIAALSVWGAVWKLSERQARSVALAAPEHAEARSAAASEPLVTLPAARTDALEPDPPALVELAAPLEPLTQREIAGLIEDLRDDEIKGNAGHAVDALCAAGPEVLLPLQRALRSTDFQQRQLAGFLLVGRDDAPLVQALADVLVEGLGDDLPPGAPGAHGSIELRYGFDLRQLYREILSLRPALFQLGLPRLTPLLDSSNPWLRFDVARIFAAQHSELARERTLAVLLEHLEDNDDSTDARITLPAIAGFGADALPVLERHSPGHDDQQRALLGHLIWLCAPASPCAHELKPEGFHALGFVPWKPLPLAQLSTIE
jgi:HEAT repeat protein